MPPSAPKGDVTVGAIGGGTLKDAYKKDIIYKLIKF